MTSKCPLGTVLIWDPCNVKFTICHLELSNYVLLSHCVTLFLLKLFPLRSWFIRCTSIPIIDLMSSTEDQLSWRENKVDNPKLHCLACFLNFINYKCYCVHSFLKWPTPIIKPVPSFIFFFSKVKKKVLLKNWREIPKIQQWWDQIPRHQEKVRTPTKRTTEPVIK